MTEQPRPHNKSAFGKIKNPRSITSKLSLGEVPEALSIDANSFCFGFIKIPD